MTAGDRPIHRKAKDYRWDGVEELPYKEDDRALFKSITRQVLFSDPELNGELRYFEVAPGGFSTLERHEHMHAVLILRGRGHCLVGGECGRSGPAISSPCRPLTWHQFRAPPGASRLASSAWSTPRATSRSSRRPRNWQSSMRMRRSRRSCATSRNRSS
jgi:hypothetical protein